MKRIILSCFFTVAFFCANSQVVKPVSWSFTSKKTGAGEYEVHLTATILSGWHIYSQTTPAGGPVPTSVSFTKNPLVTFNGSISENGKMEQKHEAIFGVDVKQFSGKVVFVQKIKLISQVKTSISGQVEYMVCDDKQCLPPATVPFTLQLK